MAYYASHADPAHYEPSNITFGIMEPLVKPPRGKMERKLAMANRALEDLAVWMRDIARLAADHRARAGNDSPR